MMFEILFNVTLLVLPISTRRVNATRLVPLVLCTRVPNTRLRTLRSAGNPGDPVAMNYAHFSIIFCAPKSLDLGDLDAL